MLGKLLKYEIKSTARIFIPSYLALIGVAIILKLFNEVGNKLELMIIPSILFWLLYGIIFIGVFVLAYAMTCIRFYRNLLGDEGYLMHTLPVKPNLHIWTKLITGLMWILGSFAMTIISVLVLAMRKDLFKDISMGFNFIMDSLGIYFGNTSVAISFIVFLVLMLASLISGLMMLLASLSAGQLLRGHRIIGAIAAYFIFNTFTQIASIIILYIMSKMAIWQALESNDFAVVNTGIINSFTLFCIFYIIFYGLLCVGYYFVMNIMLKKKLNLE